MLLSSGLVKAENKMNAVKYKDMQEESLRYVRELIYLSSDQGRNTKVTATQECLLKNNINVLERSSLDLNSVQN